jgi:hypothetical protein
MMLEIAGLRAARGAERGGLLSAMVPHPYPFNIARKFDWDRWKWGDVPVGALGVKGGNCTYRRRASQRNKHCRFPQRWHKLQNIKHSPTAKPNL